MLPHACSAVPTSSAVPHTGDTLVVNQAPRTPVADTRVANPGPATPVDRSPVGAEHEGGQLCSSESFDSSMGSDTSGMRDKPCRPPRWPVGNRQRYSRDGGIEFAVRPQLTIQGGFLAEPMVMKTSTVEGIEMVTVGGRETWLTAPATGLSHRKDPNFEHGVRMVREELKEAMVETCGQQKKKAMERAASGRRQLGLDNESSSDSDEPAAKKHRPNAPLPDIATVMSVNYRGLQFKAFFKKNKMRVEARADVAEVLVAACLDRTDEYLKQRTDEKLNKAKKKGCQPLDDADEDEKGGSPTRIPIRWITGKSTYEVRYENEEGKKIRCVRGLRVDTQDRTGEPLDEKVLDQRMQRAFRKAQNIFNELDQTSRPRLKIA